jgi:single-strand DNA-binding protein
MRKGSRVAVDGRLEWREWETSEQQKRQAVSIVAETVQFLDTPGGRRREQEQDGDLGGEDRELAGVGSGSEDAELVF